MRDKYKDRMHVREKRERREGDGRRVERTEEERRRIIVSE